MDIITGLPYFEINRIAAAEDDPSNWGIKNYLPDSQRFPDDGAGVTVAVMDTGLLPHPEIADRTIQHLNFASDALNPNSSPHGTHVSSTIGGKSAKIGWAPKVEFVDLRILDSSGSGSLSWTLEAGQWLLDNRDKFESLMLNCSFGFTGRNDAIEKMFRDLHLAKISIFGAAGNTGATEYFYPGAYNNVCTVGAMTEQEQVATFSTRNDQLDVIAAGTKIWGAFGMDSYAVFSGSSMASPQVCGLAAVKESRKRFAKTFVDYISLVRTTATDVDAVGFDKASGFGRVTPNKFLTHKVTDDETTFDPQVKPSLAFLVIIAIMLILIIVLAST